MASNRMSHGAREFGRDLKKVHVRIYPQNTADPVVEHDGGVASCVRAGSAGKFLITLTDGYFQLKHANVSYRDERDNADLYAQLGAVTGEATGGSSVVTITVKLKTATVNTDVAAGAGAKDRCIYCEFEFEDKAP